MEICKKIDKAISKAVASVKAIWRCITIDDVEAEQTYCSACNGLTTTNYEDFKMATIRFKCTVCGEYTKEII